MALSQDAILRMIVAIHFVYTSFVLMVDWLPSSYLLNQAVIIILGLWAIVNREGVIQVQLLMVIKFFSIILDIIAIGMYFQAAKTYLKSSYFVFSAFFAIFLLLLKPLMLLLLNKIRQDRLGGDTSPMFGQWGANAGHVPGYQPVDGQSSAASA